MQPFRRDHLSLSEDLRASAPIAGEAQIAARSSKLGTPNGPLGSGIRASGARFLFERLPAPSQRTTATTRSRAIDQALSGALSEHLSNDRGARGRHLGPGLCAYTPRSIPISAVR